MPKNWILCIHFVHSDNELNLGVIDLIGCAVSSQSALTNDGLFLNPHIEFRTNIVFFRKDIHGSNAMGYFPHPAPFLKEAQGRSL